MKTVSVLFLAILCSGCGGYSSPQQPSQPAVVPVLAAIIPNSANAGASAVTLTVNGSSSTTTRW